VKAKPPAKRKAPPAKPKTLEKPPPPAKTPLGPQCEPLTTVPAVPARLGAHAADCWRRLTPLLVDLKLLTPLDLEALEALCHQWQDYLVWHLMIQADPKLAIVEFDSGARQKSPEATLRDSAYDRWLKLLPRFGLSPEHLRKLRRLKEPASAGRGDRRVTEDPVAAFARRKYTDE
jgi:P27 family predicted phage terminase small subunit